MLINTQNRAKTYKQDLYQFSGQILVFHVLKDCLFVAFGQALGHRPFGYFFDEARVIFIERIEFGDAAVGLQEEFAEMRGLLDCALSDDGLSQPYFLLVVPKTHFFELRKLLKQSLETLICPLSLYSEHSMQQSFVKGVSLHEGLIQLISNRFNFTDSGLTLGHMNVLFDNRDQMFLEVMEYRSLFSLKDHRIFRQRRPFLSLSSRLQRFFLLAIDVFIMSKIYSL